MQEIVHAAVRLAVDNSSSADSEIPRVTQARSRGRCQEPGILRRVRHLRICASVAPSAFAAPAITGHLAGENMSIADTMDNMSRLSRPSVPLRDKRALPLWNMAETKARSLYRKELAGRMKRLREDSGRSQSEMARLLGVTFEAYKKQEQRGALPNDKTEAFAALVGKTVVYLVTGQEPAKRAKRAKPGKQPAIEPSRLAGRRIS